MILGQIPDPTMVVEKATGVSWEAGMLAVIIVAFMSTIIYMIKRQNDNQKVELEASAARESRMAARIDILEDEYRKSQKDFADNLVLLTKDLSTAMMETKSAMSEMRETLASLTTVMGTVNGDISKLCQMMQLCPCLLLGKYRGRFKLIDDETGKVVDLTRFSEQEGV